MHCQKLKTKLLGSGLCAIAQNEGQMPPLSLVDHWHPVGTCLQLLTQLGAAQLAPRAQARRGEVTVARVLGRAENNLTRNTEPLPERRALEVSSWTSLFKRPRCPRCRFK